jgi:hypothetical protein
VVYHPAGDVLIVNGGMTGIGAAAEFLRQGSASL